MVKIQTFKQVHQKSQKVSEKIISEIKKSVLQGKLKPGDKLPGERNLAQMFGVSRNSLREALKSLAAMGIVEIKHGQGVFIANQNFEKNLKYFLDNLNIDEKKLHELFCLRKVLETQAVEWACLYGTKEELQTIKDLIINTKKKLGQINDKLSLLAESDAKFHTLILKASHNSVLEKIMNSLLDLLNDARIQSAKKGRSLKSLNEHLLIADALINRDIPQARNAMQKHLEELEKDILS